MTTRKKIEKQNNETPSAQTIVSKTKHLLVFISHDTRDAELAEEFSNLLRNASAGTLKSFRTSDKKGPQGIEYGQEWYPAIMDKIDEASDVVCLLTHNSVGRPWILYEAGVAKGKLDKKVIGLALGIPFSLAINGPFAQFQNNDGDVDSITKLVMDLVKKVPGLDPDPQIVKTLVESFLKNITEILIKTQKQLTKGEKGESVDENSVAKLFEEVKIMFDNLPSRIENKIDPDFRRKRKFQPMMMEEFLHIGMEFKDPSLGFLMMVSMYKDDFPWFYEIGLETYHGLKIAKNISEKKKLASNFERALEIFSHPMMRELYGKSDEMYFFYKESRHFMQNFFERFFFNDKVKE
jgi:hypothetical protein